MSNLSLLKKISAFLLCISSMVNAQTTFPFETTVPAQWTTQAGILRVNGEHYKKGIQSLRWQTKGKSVLTVIPTTYATSASNCVYFQLYSPTITNDEVKVDFYNEMNLMRTLTLAINFKGWREVCRSYKEFENKTPTSITKILITLIPKNLSETRTLYFDDVNLNDITPTSRVIGSQWINDYSYFEKNANKENLLVYSNPIDIEATTPTDNELSSLASLRNNSVFNLTPKVGTSTELSAAAAYAQGLNIVRNSDGSVRGTPVPLRSTDINDALMTRLTRHLEVLAADGSSSNKLFNKLLDHLLDQGFAEGISYNMFPSNYGMVREIPKRLFNILPSCNSTQKEEMLKLCKWIIRYGELYEPQNVYLSRLNSDVIYNYCLQFMKAALNQPTDILAVRELKAFKRYMDRNSEYTSSNNGFLKPDGTGFHHNTHYPNYMYAYRTYTQFMYYLKSSSFRVERGSYDRLKKAVIAQYIMSNNSTTSDFTDKHYLPLSLSGRAGNITLNSFTRSDFENLISVGADLYGHQDDELANAYNYFFKTNKYSVAIARSYDGFFTYNFSPMAIYRQNNWVASMRSPTTKFWGSEIYSGSNRFGRYESNGTLEILYPNDITNSGYPTSLSGWDWNVVPGTTTVHYTSWTDMMPGQNTTARFDQYTKTKNYSGALSWGDFGLFSADFDQRETWGSQRYTPTNLAFKKTVLAIDQILIDLGSNISAPGSYDDSMITATNLFQNITYTNKTMQVDGANVNPSYSFTLAENTPHTLLSPVGTGYIIPKGNDAVNVLYGSQNSPNQNGSDVSKPATTVTAAKVYMVHGVKPNDKGYQFVAVPAATARTLSKLAAKVNNGEIYQVLKADSFMHAILYKPKGIMAYSFFNATDAISFGFVKGITTEALLMHRKAAGSDNVYEFAIANPNLNPTSDPLYGWVSCPTTTVLSLAGKWDLKNAADGVGLLSSTDLETKIQINLNQGEPRYFSLIQLKHNER